MTVVRKQFLSIAGTFGPTTTAMTFDDHVRKVLGLRSDDDWLRREASNKFKLRAPCDRSSTESQLAASDLAVIETVPANDSPAAPVGEALPATDRDHPRARRPMSAGPWKRAEDRARICCERLKAARVHNGYTIKEASARLDIDPMELERVENGKSFAKFWVLLRAVTVYAVPADFLLGFIDEAEASQNDYRQPILLRHMEAQLTGHTNTTINKIAKSLVEGAPALWMVHDAMAKTAEINEAWLRFRELNAEAEDMRGGGKLQSAIDALLATSNTASHALQRRYNLLEKSAELAEGQTDQYRFSFSPVEKCA
jgi:transcriptional regulator with XRE-family HTH domain